MIRRQEMKPIDRNDPNAADEMALGIVVVIGLFSVAFTFATSMIFLLT
jgi:hypothetical protein